MVEHPILFSAPMVRAILEGRKTQTRRIVDMGRLRLRTRGRIVSEIPFEPRPSADGEYHATMNPIGAVCAVLRDGREFGMRPGEFDFDCPYMPASTTQLGDFGGGRKAWVLTPSGTSRLWVRETWFPVRDARMFDPGTYALARGAFYRADRGNDRLWHDDHEEIKWRPSIHMPRWASRLSLDIVRVRVERLQAIADNDALAEGIGGLVKDREFDSARDEFAYLWDSINGKRAAWSSNPWVWVIEFRRVEV